MRRGGHAHQAALTVPEVRRLIAACLTPSERLVIRLLFYSGMRAGELAHLAPAWWRREEGVIVVPRSWPCVCAKCARRGGTWRPKTPSGARRIPVVEPDFQAALQEWRDDPRLKSRSPNRISQIVTRVSRRSGVDTYAHALRATRATYLLRNGFTDDELLRVFGWADAGEVRPYRARVRDSEVAERARQILPVAAFRDRLVEEWAERPRGPQRDVAYA